MASHSIHNKDNMRMLAFHAKRDPEKAKHLMQGLRRQHTGLRAMGAVALAHGAQRPNEPHHDEHALHLLNMAHAKVPDGADLTLTKHGPDHFNANVKRQGRQSNFPLNRQQVHDFAYGAPGGFDHSMHNGVEKNLSILTGQGQPRRGYEEGGEVTGTSSSAPDPNAAFGSEPERHLTTAERDALFGVDNPDYATAGSHGRGLAKGGPVRGYQEGGPVGDPSAPTGPDAPNPNPCAGHRDPKGSGGMCEPDPDLANYPMAGATSGA